MFLSVFSQFCLFYQICALAHQLIARDISCCHVLYPLITAPDMPRKKASLQVVNSIKTDPEPAKLQANQNLLTHWSVDTKGLLVTTEQMGACGVITTSDSEIEKL